MLGPPLWAVGSWEGSDLTLPSGGGATELSSPEFGQIDLQRAVNCYPETVEVRGGQAISGLTGIPGLATVCLLPTSPNRGAFAQDGRAFLVAGTVLYELDHNGSYTLRGGAIIDDGKPVTIDSNGQQGHQLCVTSGRRLGILDLNTNVWTPDVRTDADLACFVDGYFLSLDASTSMVWQSDFENGLAWNGLAKLQRNQGSDAFVSMGVNQRMVYLLGSKTSEVWYNAGTSPMAFAPAQSGYFEVGCGAAASVAWCDNSLMWLGESEQGPGTVWRSSGYQATRISSHALTQVLKGYSATSDAVGWAYLDRDHPFYLLSFPTAGATWAYDASTGLWAERAYWDTSTCLWAQYKPRFHCYAFGKHLVGDGATGAIYSLDRGTYTDAGGTPLRRMRQGPYASQRMQRIFHRGCWIDVETGVGNADCLAPQIMFEKSDDKGKTWDSLGDKPLGAQGNPNTRVEWKRLGSARQRAYRAIVSDPVPLHYANAYLDIEAGQ